MKGGVCHEDKKGAEKSLIDVQVQKFLLITRVDCMQ